VRPEEPDHEHAQQRDSERERDDDGGRHERLTPPARTGRT
jgi:hypothetical protein